MPNSGKRVNVWLYVILSFIPLANLYPLLKLKRFWKMIAIRLCVVVPGVLVTLYINNIGPMIIVYTALLVLDAPFVYRWAVAHNKKLEHEIPT